MSATKKVLGDYNIKTVGTESNVHVTTHTVHVHGNLIVFGSSSSITSNNTQITDNFITLNAGWNLEPTLNAGIEVERGFISNVAVPHAKIIWNETLDAWQLDNGTTVEYILTSTTGPNAGLEKVEDDPAPKLGGNLNTNNFLIYDTGNVRLQSAQSTTITSTDVKLFDVANLSNTATLKVGAPEGGATGIYVTNSQVSQQELITKTKAIVYSIIF